MGIGQDDIAGVEAGGVIELPPIGGDHVGSHLELGGVFEFPHDLAAAEASLGTAGVLHIGDDAVHVAAEGDGFLEAPRAVRIDVDPGVGEPLLDGLDGLHFLLAPQHAALELKVLHAVFFGHGLSLLHDVLRGQHLLAAQAEPGIGAVAFVDILHIPRGHLALVGHIEEIAQHLHLGPLLAFAQELAHGHLQVLAQQVQHGALDGPLAAHHVFELGDIQGLDALRRVVGLGIGRLMDALEHLTALRYGHALHQGTHGHEAVVGVIAAVDLADARMARGILQNDDIAGEARSVAAGQGHEHAVIARHRDDLHAGYHRYVHGAPPQLFLGSAMNLISSSRF